MRVLDPGGMLFIADLRRSWLGWIEGEIRSALTVHGQHLVRDNPMDYDTFRALWHAALSASGLLPFPPRPSEAIDLQGMNRTYRIYVSMPDARRARPFHVTATLSWRWDALHAARSATTEEDLLTELFGRVGYDLVTERPWLRVDVTLNATLPYDAPLPMPDARAWQRWARQVTRRLEPLLPAAFPDVEDEEWEAILFWRGDPEAQLRCSPDGQLHLTGVELPSWQGIELPRQWDSPDRPQDDDTEEQLESLFEWVRASLEVWAECLPYLEKS
jgi:hypothetical protein